MDDETTTTTTATSSRDAEADTSAHAEPELFPAAPPAGKSKSGKRKRGGYPSGLVRGVCRQCGATADSHSATWCAEHRPLGPDKAPRTRQRPSDAVADELAASIESQLGLVAMMWELRDPVCGKALRDSAPQIATYWANRARESARFARALETMVGGGGLLAGLAIHAPLILAIAQHHVMPAMQRRQQLDHEPEQYPEPTVPRAPAFADPAPGTWPNPGDVRDQAHVPVGTAPDPAAEAAARWTDPDAEQLQAQPWPILTDDGGIGWALGEEEAARAAMAGEPFGIAVGGPYAGHADD